VLSHLTHSGVIFFYLHSRDSEAGWQSDSYPIGVICYSVTGAHVDNTSKALFVQLLFSAAP